MIPPHSIATGRGSPRLGLARRLLLAAFALSAPGVAAPQELKGRVFTDPVEGLRLSIPKDWERLPTNVDQRQIIGWFESTARFQGDPKKGDTGGSRHALLRIVRVQKPKPGVPGDYARWLAATLKKDTYQVDVQAGTAGDQTSVVRWNVTVAGPQLDRERIIAWVFAADGCEFAVEFRFLEEHARSLKPAALRSLGSFRIIPKTAPPPRPRGSTRPFVLRDWLRLPLLERHRRRAEMEQDHLQKMLARLPKGWTVLRNDDFLLLSHTDAKTTKHVFNTVAAFRKWLEVRFGALSDEYRVKFTVRVCKDNAEYDAYRAGGWHAKHDFGQREIVMRNDRGALGLDSVLHAVFRRYMLDVAPEVYFNMPVWLWHGLEGLIARATLKERKIDFPASLEEVTVYDRLRRSDKLQVKTVVELMNHATFGYVPDQAVTDGDLVTQAQVLVRFFAGPGRRCRALRGSDFLVTYMSGIQQLAREFDADDDDVLVWDSEETIAARLQARAAAESTDQKPRRTPPVPALGERWDAYYKTVRERRPNFLRELHRRVCGWSPAEWSEVERAYAMYCKGHVR